MSSNDSNQDWYDNAGDIAFRIEYYYITPVYFVFGLLGHLAFFSALYEQAKKEKAYIYQIFVVLSETGEIVAYVLYVASLEWWSGLERPGAKWYNSCYACMWYSAHVSVALANAFITTSLMLSISMTIDRVLALSKPFSYKQFKHKVNQIISLSVCVIIGFGTSIYQCLVYELYYDPVASVYVLKVNESFLTGFTCFFFGQFRNAIRIAGVLMIFVCNILLLYFFHKTPAVQTTTAQEKKKRDRERTLAIVAACQSLLNMTGMSFLISYYIWDYSSPTFYKTVALLFRPIVDAAMQVTDLADFYVLMVVSKAFRRMVITSLPWYGKCCTGQQTSSVAPTTGSHASTIQVKSTNM